MTMQKTTVNVEIDADVKDQASPQTPAEQILYHIERLGIPKIELPVDENGHAYIDKEKYPDLYDWAVNG